MIPNPYKTKCLELVKAILLEDKEFQDSCVRQHGAATFCSQCQRNTHVGFYPDHSDFKRRLCSDCGETYLEFLKSLNLF